MSVKNRIIKLRDIINDHNFKYYVLDEPVISDSEYDKNIPIRDYYVMSSYNSCSGGESWQDWVSIDILREVINYGIRCVDLEIYYKNGKCVESEVDNMHGFKLGIITIEIVCTNGLFDN